MKHEIKENDGVTVVALEGDVDLESSPEARKVILQCVEKKQPVLVDLAGVGYIDSSGVASLVESFQTARKYNLNFALVSVSEGALRVLQLARLDKVFSIYGSLDEGLAGVK